MQKQSITSLPLFSDIDSVNQLSPYCVLIHNKSKLRRGWWQVYEFPKKPSPKNDCREVCPHKLRRKHLTCRTCRTRRAYQGEIPLMLKVTPYTILIHRDRKYAGVKQKILQKLGTIMEMVAN